MRSSWRAWGVRAPAILQTLYWAAPFSSWARSGCLRLSIEAISGGPAILPPGHLPEQQLIAAGGQKGVLHALQHLLWQAGGHLVDQAATPVGQFDELRGGVHLDPLCIPFVRRPRALGQTFPYVAKAPQAGQKSSDELRELVNGGCPEKEIGIAAGDGGLLL